MIFFSPVHEVDNNASYPASLGNNKCSVKDIDKNNNNNNIGCVSGNLLAWPK